MLSGVDKFALTPYFHMVILELPRRGGDGGGGTLIFSSNPGSVYSFGFKYFFSEKNDIFGGRRGGGGGGVEGMGREWGGDGDGDLWIILRGHL